MQGVPSWLSESEDLASSLLWLLQLWCGFSLWPEDFHMPWGNDTCVSLFTAALFTIAKIWKQPRCPSADELHKDVIYIYTMEYYSAIKNKILFVLLLLFRTVPMAYGSSQARESELQLPASTTATATRDPICICNLHHSSCQHWILNLLSEVRD